MSNFRIITGDTLVELKNFPDQSFDLIFCDPPYNLSNDGITCKSGKMTSVNKGDWDKSHGFENDLEFHKQWLSESKRLLKENGTLWVTGTYHSIYLCAYIMMQLDFCIINDVAWYKPNAAPNISCRCLTASHETIIWAKKSKEAKHTFNYKAMKSHSDKDDIFKREDKQMRSVWSISPPSSREKSHGKHPTQKPVTLLERIVLASSNANDEILDPFCGSGTTGVAAVKHGRNFTGIEVEHEYVELATKRIQEASYMNNSLFSLE